MLQPVLHLVLLLLFLLVLLRVLLLLFLLVLPRVLLLVLLPVLHLRLFHQVKVHQVQ
jgi:hypothetical protein